MSKLEEELSTPEGQEKVKGEFDKFILFQNVLFFVKLALSIFCLASVYRTLLELTGSELIAFLGVLGIVLFLFATNKLGSRYVSKSDTARMFAELKGGKSMHFDASKLSKDIIKKMQVELIEEIKKMDGVEDAEMTEEVYDDSVVVGMKVKASKPINDDDIYKVAKKLVDKYNQDN